MKQIKAHPLMIFSYLYPFIFIFLIPVLRKVLSAVLSRAFTWLFVTEIVMISVVCALAVANWLCCRILVDGERIILKRGFLLRTETVLHRRNISCISQESNPISVLFSAVTVRIDTEAGRKSRSDFRAIVYKKDAEELCRVLHYDKSGVNYKIGGARVAIMAAATSSVAVGALFAAPIINKAGKLLGIALTDRLLTTITDTSNALGGMIPPIVNAVSLVFLGLYLVSFLLTLSKQAVMRLHLTDEVISIRAGFFPRRHIYFKKTSINNIIIERSPLMRFLHRALIKVSVAGYGAQKGEGAAVVPAARCEEIDPLLERLFGLARPTDKLITAKRGTLWRFVRWYLVLFASVPVAGAVLSYLFPDFLDLIRFLSLVFSAVALYLIELSFFAYRHSCVCFANKFVFARGVRAQRVREIFCRRDRVGLLRLRRYPADRKRGTCIFTVTMRSESAESVRVKYVDYKSVREYCRTFWEK